MDPESAELDIVVEEIANVSFENHAFWSAACGWAPDRAAELLGRSRLDWLSSLGRTLAWRLSELRTHPEEAGSLIVAWAHLRALVEGNLKLFLSVYLEDYLEDEHVPARHGEVIWPESLAYEQIMQFVRKRELFTGWEAFLVNVQHRGNSIHPFSSRELGSAEDYCDHLVLFRDFVRQLSFLLPRP